MISLYTEIEICRFWLKTMDNSMAFCSDFFEVSTPITPHWKVLGSFPMAFFFPESDSGRL